MIIEDVAPQDENDYCLIICLKVIVDILTDKSHKSSLPKLLGRLLTD